MTIKTSTLIRRHILSLQPREIFYRKDLLRYGKENVVDRYIYQLVKSGAVIRLLKGIYIRRQNDGWKPSVQEISLIRAHMLGRIITEDPKSSLEKICNQDQLSETLCFNTTGRSIKFKYDDRIIQF